MCTIIYYCDIMNKSKFISFRVQPSLKSAFTRLLELDHRNVSDEARYVFQIGTRERLKEIALEKYQNSELTAGKASELAEIPIWEFIEILQQRKISYNLDIEAVIKAISD